MRLLTGSLIAVALVALLVAGGAEVVQAPAGKTGDSPSEQRLTCCGTVPVLPGDVPEVVVTAERPAWVMPEVLVSANRMPEVVVRATSARPEMAL